MFWWAESVETVCFTLGLERVEDGRWDAEGRFGG